MAQAPLTWTNPLPGSVGKDLGIIFDSLSNFLANPSFPYGVSVGDGTTSTWNPSTGVANLRLVSSADIPFTNDTSLPGTPTITAHPAIQSVVLSWAPITTAGGFTAASYVAQLSTSSTFTSIAQSATPTGPVASFAGLTAGTTYYARVAAVSTGGTQGAWSASASFTTTTATSGDIAANSVVAGKIATGSISAGDGVIASLGADKIVAGTINTQTIQLGASGGTAALQSTNFVAGSAGWRIRGDGTAEFSNIVVRGATFSGSISASTITGSTITTASSAPRVSLGTASVSTWGQPTGSSPALQFDTGAANDSGIPAIIYGKPAAGSGITTSDIILLSGNAQNAAHSAASVDAGGFTALYSSTGISSSAAQQYSQLVLGNNSAQIAVQDETVGGSPITTLTVTPTSVSTSSPLSAQYLTGTYADGAITGGSGGAVMTHAGNVFSVNWETVGGHPTLTFWIDTTQVASIQGGHFL